MESISVGAAWAGRPISAERGMSSVLREQNLGRVVGECGAAVEGLQVLAPSDEIGPACRYSRP